MFRHNNRIVVSHLGAKLEKCRRNKIAPSPVLVESFGSLMLLSHSTGRNHSSVLSLECLKLDATGSILRWITSDSECGPLRRQAAGMCVAWCSYCGNLMSFGHRPSSTQTRTLRTVVMSLRSSRESSIVPSYVV
jgi:hypothetical protein